MDLRIDHYIRTLDPAFGGVQAHLSDLARLMWDAGVDVRIYSAHPTPCPETLMGDDAPAVIGVSKATRRGGAFSKPQLDELLERMRGADVVHLHGCWELETEQIASRLRAERRPYVCSPHGMLDDWCMAKSAVRKRAYMALLARRRFNGAAGIFFCAAGEREQASRWIDVERGRVIPAATDLAPFEDLPGPDLAREAVPGTEGDWPVVLFLSRIHPKKGIEVLIDAMAGVWRDHPEARLVVAGTGPQPYADRVRARVDRMGLSDRIVFAGFVAGREKVSLYQRASTLALPTQQENFGLVLTESLAAGTPVITTRTVDIWRELEDSGGGVIAERTPEAFADAINSALSDPDHASSMGASGREWVRRELSRASLTSRFLDGYRAAISLAGVSRPVSHS